MSLPKNSSGPLGLYVHIPFCHARCGYCDFVTFTGKDDAVDAYVDALCAELQQYANLLASPEISTIFFGGGTPSLLESKPIQKIFKVIGESFILTPEAEISIEANPESVTVDKLTAWRKAGINRLSLGLQAMDDDLLKAMGRLHTAQEFSDAFHSARAQGFDNINIDLIYGFPGQLMPSWHETIRAVLAHEPEHLSLYALAVEDHTPFSVQGARVDPDLQAEMYAWARAELSLAGFEQYEISNFARPGRACRHNLLYWRGQDYLGVGVGAVGYRAGGRWENHKNLPAYHTDVAAGRLPRATEELIDAATNKFERLMLGLRLREGYDWDETDPKWLTQRTALASKGWLEEVRPGTWRIPDPYVPLTNQILLPFLP